MGVVSTLDTYNWVENFFYVASFLDFFQLQNECLIIVYEYAKFMLFWVIEIYACYMMCVNMLDSSHGHLVAMNLC